MNKPASTSIRVAMIEDQEIARKAIKATLKSASRIIWAGEAEDGAAGIALVQEQKPDVVIVDYHLQELDGLDLIEAIQNASPNTLIISFTGQDDAFLLLQLVEAGCQAVFTKGKTRDFAKDIEQLVDQGKRLLQEELGAKIVEASLQRQVIHRLNPSEKIYFLRVGQGIDHESIAKELKIKPNSVKKLLTNTRKKLGVKDKEALITLYKTFFPGGWRKTTKLQ